MPADKLTKLTFDIQAFYSFWDIIQGLKLLTKTQYQELVQSQLISQDSQDNSLHVQDPKYNQTELMLSEPKPSFPQNQKGV